MLNILLESNFIKPYFNLCILFGCISNILFGISELNLLSVRISGQIINVNLLKSIFYIINILLLIIFFYFDKVDIVNLFLIQLFGSLSYLIIGHFIVRKFYDGVKLTELFDIQVPWKMLIRVGGSDVLTRLSGSITPGAEKAILFIVGGGGIVAAYDICQRLSQLISTLPSLITSPLTTFFAKNFGNDDHASTSKIYKLSNYFVIGSTLFNSMVVIYISNEYAVSFFNIEIENFRLISNLVIIYTALNVMSIVETNFLQIYRFTKQLYIKSISDAIIVIFAIFLLNYSSSINNFFIYKYCSLAIISILYIFYCKNFIDAYFKKIVNG
jgi:O-antigen/teichoic acid export membrane protein